MEAIAKLNNCPTSPRKMRLVVDLIRGERVEKALYILKYTNKEVAIRVEKLLLSEPTEKNNSGEIVSSLAITNSFSFCVIVFCSIILN